MEKIIKIKVSDKKTKAIFVMESGERVLVELDKIPAVPVELVKGEVRKIIIK